MVTRSINPKAGSRRVMLVTADPAGRQELATALEVNGFRVDIVGRFEEACARVTILSPDLVLADLSSQQDPDVSNKCQKLVRCSEQGPAASPVIILGGTESFALTAELMEAGPTTSSATLSPCETCFAALRSPWSRRSPRPDPALLMRRQNRVREAGPTLALTLAGRKYLGPPRLPARGPPARGPSRSTAC